MNLGRRKARLTARRASVGQTEADFFESAFNRDPGIFLREPPRRQGQFLHAPPRRQVPISSDYIPYDEPVDVPQDFGIPGCGPGSSTCNVKMIAKTVTVAQTSTETVRFTTPGAFCPYRMYIFSSIEDSTFIGSIKSGLEEQIILRTGPITAQLFSIANDCCPVYCIPCICQPAVPLDVEVINIEPLIGDPITVTVVFIGVYLDASDPRYRLENGCPPRFMTDISVPGCTPEGDKLLGLAAVLDPGSTATIRLETPGKFCVRQIFFSDVEDGFTQITRLQIGLKHQIISGALPTRLFTRANECCVLSYLDCICAPGVPLTISFRNTDAEGPHLIFGALVGCYEDACP